MPKPPTFMMLKEILDQWEGRTTTFGSSARGRCRFMDATLWELGRGTRLAEDRYTPDHQDRLGFHLLRCRGYDKWIKGALSDGAFMRNLAKEWASFPVPTSSRAAGGRGARSELLCGARPEQGPRLTPRLASRAAAGCDRRASLACRWMSADVGLAASITEKAERIWIETL